MTSPSPFAIVVSQPHHEPETHKARSKDVHGPEVAELWKIDPKTVLKLFRNEPGVLSIPIFNSDGGRKGNYSLRIPSTVFERVRSDLTNK